jgi:hypothetical protein
MKTKTATLLAGSVLSAAVFALIAVSGPSPAPPADAKPAVTKTERRAKAKLPAPAVTEVDETTEAEDPMLQLPSADEESANLAVWKQRFEAIIAETGDSQRAVERLRAEIDTALTAWVSSEIEPIASLPPGERYDKLDLIEQSVTEGAAAIFESLGVPGGRHAATAANARDLVAAEIQYAETAPDPASRLALLRLDRERQSRLDEVVGVADEEQRAKAESELEEWYSQGLAKVFPEDAISFEAP